jgi:hypothetical protein
MIRCTKYHELSITPVRLNKYLHWHPGRSGSEVTLWESFRVLCVLWLALQVALHLECVISLAPFFSQTVSLYYQVTL